MMFLLAWKNLTQSRTQFLLGVGGVALALLLMLSLDALLAGSEEDLVAYIENSGAEVFVAQEGVKNMHMAVSAITLRDVRLAAHAPGVASASPVLYTTSVIKAGRADVLSYIIGFDPDEPLGGPQGIVEGTSELSRNEAIIDQAVAHNQSVELGDEVEIFGKEFIVVGITKGLTNIINSVTFIHLKDYQEIRPGDSVSYALLALETGVGAENVAATISARNDEVLALSAAEFAHEERQIIKDMSVEILYIMNLSGLLIGLAVTALTLYTSTLRKKQEYGVLKAIGAPNRDLYLVVGAQAIISLALGFVMSLGMVWLMGAALPLFVPGIGLALTQASLTKIMIAALVIGVLAALTPAWQLAQLDPAQVFRG
jgi:putative ABC transport system permease protein